MSLSACNGMFEGIYDDPIEAEMEIKESSFSQINATEYTNWVYIDLSERKAMTVEIGEEHKSEIPAECFRSRMGRQTKGRKRKISSGGTGDFGASRSRRRLDPGYQWTVRV